MSERRWDVIDVLTALPETLRSVRLLRGKSLRQVAKETGLSFSTVTRIENGEDCALSSAKKLLLWIGGDPWHDAQPPMRSRPDAPDATSEARP